MKQFGSFTTVHNLQTENNKNPLTNSRLQKSFQIPYLLFQTYTNISLIKSYPTNIKKPLLANTLDAYRCMILNCNLCERLIKYCMLLTHTFIGECKGLTFHFRPQSTLHLATIALSFCFTSFLCCM